MEKMVVVAKTPTFNIFLIDGEGTAMMQTPEMNSKLNAADPTMVEGPSSPGSLLRVVTVSMTESNISGALEPSAIRVKLATVSFQINVLMTLLLPCWSWYLIIFVCDVIVSIALYNKISNGYLIKISATMEMPKNK